MSAVTQTITRGQTGTISSYPPRLGVPTSVTCRVGTSAVSVPSSFSAATVDADSDTLDDEGRQGDTEIAITTGNIDVVKGRRYLIAPVSGLDTDAMPFDVEAVSTQSSALSMQLRHGLPRSAEAGSLLLEWRCSVAITTNQSATAGDAFVEFLATVDGHLIKWIEPFRVVERGGYYDLTGDLLVQLSPYARSHRSEEDPDFSQTIEAAWVMHLSPALLGKGIRPEQIANWQAVNPAHVKAVEMLLAQAYDQDAQVRSEKHLAFTTAFIAALDSMQFWLTPAQDPSPPNAGEPTSIFNATDITR